MKNKSLIFFMFVTLLFSIYIISSTITQIAWPSPTPNDGVTVTDNFVFLNTTIESNNGNSSAWFDWNKSLVGYWSFDYYNSTGIYDNSSHGNFGTFNGDVFGTSNLTTGSRGQGLTFDGVDDRINVGETPSTRLNGSVTLSAWVKFDSAVANSSKIYGEMIVGRNGAYGLSRNPSTNVIDLYIKGTDFVYGTKNTWIAGEWYHIVGVGNETKGTIYIDGVLDATGSITWNPENFVTPVIIGAGENWILNETTFSGSIDEVMIFNRSLSQSEISAIYNNSANRLYNNFTNLSDGTYNYSVYSIDGDGTLNITSDRQVTYNDSSVLKNCGTLSTPGTTYTLTSNVTSTGSCFTIGADNVTLDCAGYWIVFSTTGGSETRGVFSEKFNTTIKNCNIQDGNWTSAQTTRRGIFLYMNSNSTLINNFVNVSNSVAIYLNRANFNNIINSTGISNSSYGIDIGLSNGNYIFNSSGISAASAGIAISTSSNNVVVNSTGNGTSRGFANTIGIWLINANYTLIINSTAQSVDRNGLRLDSSEFNNITNTRAISNNSEGFGLLNSSYNMLTNVTASSNSGSSMVLTQYWDGTGYSYNNIVINSTLLSQTTIALHLSSNSTNNTFFGNTLISGDRTSNLLHLDSSASSNTFYWNNFTDTSGYYVNDLNGSNYYNTTINGKNEGNIWFNVMNNNVNINGSVLSGFGAGLYIGNSGLGYPYNSTTSIGKVTSNVIDYAPLTPNKDSVPPTISFESPTPGNASTVNYSNQNIVANISDNSAGNTSSFIDFDRSLVGYWSMDYYNTGGIFDNSTYSNYAYFGNSLNSSGITTGIRGKALNFNGGDDYLSTDSGDDFDLQTQSWTYSLWIKEIGTERMYIMTKGASGGYNGSRIETRTDHKGGAIFGGSSNYVNIYGPGILLNDSNWHHIAVIFDRTGDGIWYTDGIAGTPVDISSYSNEDISSSSNFMLSGNMGVGINGSLDEVMIFNRSLSQSEISALYNSQINKFNASFSNLSEGQHNYTVYAIDESGNYNSSGERNFFVDTSLQCGTLNTPGTTYTLTSNVSSTGTCFSITAQNITLDCAGYWINYSTGGVASTYGVYTNQFNTTIKNCNIVDGNWTSNETWRNGVYINFATGSIIENNTINVSYGLGIVLISSNNSILSSNIVTSNSSRAIQLSSSSNNTLTENNGTSNTNYGIILESSSTNNTLTENNGTSNTGVGIIIGTSSNNLLVGNIGFSGSNIGIYVPSSSYNNLTNNTGISDSNIGLYLVSANNHILTSNTGTSNTNQGILLESSSNNTLISNIGTSNTNRGILLESSSNNTLISNIGTSNNSHGIRLVLSPNNILSNNTGTSNASAGISINSLSNNNTLTNNHGASLFGGIGIYVYNSTNNTLTSNTGTSNSWAGISIELSSNNTLISNIGTSNTSRGILLTSSNETSLISNTGASNTNRGLYFEFSSNNTLTNNTGTSNSSYGIFIYQSFNNVFINQTAKTLGTTGSSRYGVVIYQSNNTIFRDCVNISGATQDVYYDSSLGSINNTFINCSYSKESVNGAGNELIRQWYYQSYVNDSSGNPIQNVNISAYNSSGYFAWSALTDSSGLIEKQNITEYINTGGTKRYYNNYTIYVNVSGYSGGINYYNVSFNMNKLNNFFTLIINDLGNDDSDSFSTTNPTVTTPVSSKQLEKTYEKTFRENAQIKFEFNNEETFAKITSISNEEISINIDNKEYIFKINETKKIDLDNDGFYDLEVNAGSITNYGTMVRMKFKTIYEEIASQEESPVEEPSKQKIVEDILNNKNTDKQNKYVFYFIVGIIVGIGILIVLIQYFILNGRIRLKKKK